MPSETTPRILRRSIVKSPGSVAPTAREGRDHPGMDVRRTAHDAQLAVTEVDVGQTDPVGIGMRYDVEDLGDDDAVDVAPGLVDLLDFEAELVQRVRDVGRCGIDRRELTDPGERGAHEVTSVLRIGGRKRTSPSQTFLTWSMP